MTAILVPPGSRKHAAIDAAQWHDARDGAAFLCIGQRCTLPLRHPARLRDEFFSLLREGA